MSAMEARSVEIQRFRPSRKTGARFMTPFVTEFAHALWQALCEWSEHRRAVAHLRSMSDGNLQDLGLKRSEISAAVYGERSSRAHHGDHV